MTDPVQPAWHPRHVAITAALALLNGIVWTLAVVVHVC